IGRRGAAWSSPVADVVLGPVGLVRSLRVQVVGTLVARAGITILVGLAPGIEGRLVAGRVDVGPVPAVRLAGRRREQRRQALAGGGIVAQLDAVAHQRSLEGVADEDLRDRLLAAAEDFIAVADREPREQADDGQHDEDFEQGKGGATRGFHGSKISGAAPWGRRVRGSSGARAWPGAGRFPGRSPPSARPLRRAYRAWRPAAPGLVPDRSQPPRAEAPAGAPRPWPA